MSVARQHGPGTAALAVSLADVQAAARRLEGQVVLTPCLPSQPLSELLGCQLTLKFENLQYCSSFKDRGAYVKLASLTEEERRRGVIAMSAGNHAQGALFRSGRHLITPALADRIDRIAQCNEGFFVGRFDVRYSDVDAFKASAAHQPDHRHHQQPGGGVQRHFAFEWMRVGGDGFHRPLHEQCVEQT